MTWRIEFLPAAARQFEALDKPVRTRVARSLKRLGADPPSAPNVVAMTSGFYRMRVGDWRVVFTLEDTVLLVTVVRIAHRREAYR